MGYGCMQHTSKLKEPLKFTLRLPGFESIIEFYKTEKIKLVNLSDDEARLAGVSTTKIVDLFERWY